MLICICEVTILYLIKSLSLNFFTESFQFLPFSYLSLTSFISIEWLIKSSYGYYKHNVLLDRTVNTIVID